MSQFVLMYMVCLILPIKQMEQTTSVQEQLLAHVLGDKDLEVYSLMSSLVAAEDNTPASTESSRSNSPTDG